MSGRWKQRSLFTRLLVYAALATLAFILAAGVGAAAALVASGNLSWPTGGSARPKEPGPAGEQGKPPRSKKADAGAEADRPQLENSGARREQASSKDKQTTYVHQVGQMQAKAVKTSLDSNEKLLRYDALTSNNIEKMQDNQATLHGIIDQANDLEAPKKYSEQKETFLSALDELHQAAHISYALAADPTSATQSGFRKYDRHMDKAATLLQESNKTLDRHYKTVEGVRSVNTT